MHVQLVLPARCLHRHCPTPSRLSPHMSTPMALLVTRQETDVFNQPLSFDVSSVTDMSSMFEVRPA